MIYLVPQMVGFIRNMGQDIPLQTRILIQVSNFFVGYWWAVIAAPFVLWFGIKTAAKTNPAVAYAIDDLKLRIPYVGPILRKIILSRFASSFAMMYRSGITVLDAIRSLARRSSATARSRTRCAPPASRSPKARA